MKFCGEKAFIACNVLVTGYYVFTLAVLDCPSARRTSVHTLFPYITTYLFTNCVQILHMRWYNVLLGIVNRHILMIPNRIIPHVNLPKRSVASFPFTIWNIRVKLKHD